MRRFTLVVLGSLAVLGGCDSGGAKPSPSPSAPAAPGEDPTPEASDPTIATYKPRPRDPQAASGASPSPASEDPARKAVRDYFTRVNQLLPAPKHGVPAEVKDADALLTTLRQRADEVRRLEPPALCLEHHRQVVGLVDAGIALVDRMRLLRDTKDQTALLGFASDRRALDDQEKQIDALAAEITAAP